MLSSRVPPIQRGKTWSDVNSTPDRKHHAHSFNCCSYVGRTSRSRGGGQRSPQFLDIRVLSSGAVTGAFPRRTGPHDQRVDQVHLAYLVGQLGREPAPPTRGCSIRGPPGEASRDRGCGALGYDSATPCCYLDPSRRSRRLAPVRPLHPCLGGGSPHSEALRCGGWPSRGGAGALGRAPGGRGVGDERPATRIG